MTVTMSASAGGATRVSSVTGISVAPAAEFPRSPYGDGEKVPVVLIDPRPLTRESVVDLLTRMARDFAVTPVPSAADLPESGMLEAVELIILNVGAASIGDPKVGAEMSTIARRVPHAPLVLLSDRDDVGQFGEALRRGIRGYIPTTFSPMVAVEAMRLVHAGGTFIPAYALPQAGNGVEDPGRPGGDRDPDGAARAVAVYAAPAGPVAANAQPGGAASTEAERVMASLTPRQRDVLNLLCMGKPNKIIAHALQMQEGTVKVHVRQIMRKLKATNRTQVAFLARQLCRQFDGEA